MHKLKKKLPQKIESLNMATTQITDVSSIFTRFKRYSQEGETGFFRPGKKLVSLGNQVLKFHGRTIDHFFCSDQLNRLLKFAKNIFYEIIFPKFNSERKTRNCVCFSPLV